MSLLDDLKAKADKNDDGKVSKDDLESLKDGDNDSKVDKLKGMADQNDDGRLDPDDAKNIDLGGTMDNLKKKIM